LVSLRLSIHFLICTAVCSYVVLLVELVATTKYDNFLPGISSTWHVV
jgi:hypothetical protein